MHGKRPRLPGRDRLSLPKALTYAFIVTLIGTVLLFMFRMHPHGSQGSIQLRAEQHQHSSLPQDAISSKNDISIHQQEVAAMQINRGTVNTQPSSAIKPANIQSTGTHRTDVQLGSVTNGKPIISTAVLQPLQPVNVAIMTGHFFGGEYERTVPHCTFQSQPLQCNWGHVDASQADVLWYHAPSFCSNGKANIQKSRPEQLSIVMSMESSAYYNCLDNVAYMDSFDMEMTYRLCSHVTVHYFDFTHETVRTRFFSPPKPFEDKINAVAYVNSNCGAVSGRDNMVKALMDTGKIAVHAHGNCLRNQPSRGSFDKIELFSSYKFCICIENSLQKDYMTEKLWNGFTAGCVPIYLGPSNVADFLPDPDSIVLWSDYPTADALADELLRLSQDKAAYEEKLKWKHAKKISEVGVGLRSLMGMDVAPQFHTQCQVCQLVAKHRQTPIKFTGSHCMRNQTWLKNDKTSWLPGSEGYAAITDSIDFNLPG